MKAVALGELLMRLSPEGHKRILQADRLEMTFGGGEANVAVALACLGEEAAYVGKLPLNMAGEAAFSFLRRYGVDTRHVVRGEGRMGIYFAEHGASQRADRILYDRAGSCFALSRPEEYDWEGIFAGAAWLHVTGITPALGEGARQVALRAIAEARARGVTVSFDPNFRANLWTEDEARPVFAEMAKGTDVLIASSDGLSLFGIPPAGTDEAACRLVAEEMQKKYGIRTVALTMRRCVSASRNGWRAMLFDGAAHYSKEYDLCIVDRIGGGDAFAAGLIYALGKGMPAQDAVEFAAAAGALKHSEEGDQLLASREEILSVVRDGSGRIAR